MGGKQNKELLEQNMMSTKSTKKETKISNKY